MPGPPGDVNAEAGRPATVGMLGNSDDLPVVSSKVVTMKCWRLIAVVVFPLASCGADDSDVAVSAEREVGSRSVLQEPRGEDGVERPSDTQAGDRPSAEPDVYLDVSNQSFFDPDVHITIRGGAETYVDDSFPVEGQHHIVSYQLTLGAGTHHLTVSSDSGATEDLTVDVRDDGPTYVFLSYWADEGSRPWFDADQSRQPFAYG